jgi:hypothetical protein
MWKTKRGFLDSLTFCAYATAGLPAAWEENDFLNILNNLERSTVTRCSIGAVTVWLQKSAKDETGWISLFRQRLMQAKGRFFFSSFDSRAKGRLRQRA